MTKGRIYKWLLLIPALVTAGSSCSTVKKVLALDNDRERQAPIASPFEGYLSGGAEAKKSENIVLRTRKGDRSVEVELPGASGDVSDFVVPMSPAFNDGRAPASAAEAALDERWKEKTPGITDREITNSLPQGKPDDEQKRREIETGLGVVQSEDSAPAADRSYLASLDHVKQLYRAARYEAALMELDDMLRAFPTDARLYEMRGTLLDRVGRTDLAMKSWSQALRLNPGNASLRKFMERKQQIQRIPAAQ